MIPLFPSIPDGLLGMNRRNACYTLPHNQREFYPFVDDKLITKEILENHHLPAPPLYFAISGNYELKLLGEIHLHHEFVIKPARGAEGRGILVIVDKKDKKWKKASGEWLSVEDIEYHVANILAGLYSLGGVDDRAFIEYCVKSHAVFHPVAFRGVPDIRVVLYRGVPVMSMLRLPTKESGARANLHQGAAGAGIDMVRGITLGAVHHNRLIEQHPDTGVPIAGIKIPFWEDILETAAKTFDVFKLGYLGADFVVDQILGPLILELNARPGLNIQLANRTGLLSRLEAVDRFGPDVEKWDWKKRLEISKEIVNE